MQNEGLPCDNATLQEDYKVVVQQQIFIEHLAHARHVGNIREQNRPISLLSGPYTLGRGFMQMAVSKNIINKQTTHNRRKCVFKKIEKVD